MQRAPIVSISAVLLLIGGSAEAQFTVQQPVYGVTSVNTTVSVPDSGGAYLGGVGQSAAGGPLVSPFRPGFVGGATHTHSGISAHVWIHDPLAADHRLLRGAVASETALSNPRAEHAWQQLLRSRSEVATTTTAARAQRTSRPSEDRRAIAKAAAEAARQYELGRAAEERGRPGVARLHYRAAERQGSSAARERLAALDAGQLAVPTIARSPD